MTNDLTSIWSDLWKTVDSVNGLLSSGVGLPAELVVTLRKFQAIDHRQFAGNHNGQLVQAISYWKAYRLALWNNADASGPELVEDQDASAAESVA
ncbi:hypothetical protein [Bradyrhizobium embrapense]|uniref:hypothetical protein n=1 Tax=Bradyrhizobium embrapense TaxID=630921 RepID=UPI00067BBBBD|nr:hypothetical protein [Bradyrhizobium embrapense]